MSFGSITAVTSGSVTVPAGSAGDILVAFTFSATGAPAGYTQRDSTTVSGFSVRVWTKTRVSGDTGATHVFTGSSPIIHLLNLTGVGEVPVTASNTGSSGSVLGLSVSPAAAATLCFWGVAISAGMGGTPSGMTQRGIAGTQTQSWTSEVSAGATGTRDLGTVGTTWATFMAAFAVAGGPTNTPVAANATVSQTPAVTRNVGASKSGSVAQTPTVLRSRSVTVSATVTQAPSRLRNTGKSGAATVTSSTGSAPVVTGIGQNQSTTVAQTPTRARAVSPTAKTVTNAQTPARAAAAAAARTITASIAQLATLAKGQGFFRTASATQVQTPTVDVQQSSGGAHLMTLSAVIAQTFVIARAVGRTRTGTQAQTPSLVKGQGFFRAGAATVTQVPARARTAGVGRGATQTQTGLVARAFGVARTATQALSPSRVRSIARSVAALATQAPAILKGRLFEFLTSVDVVQTPDATAEPHAGTDPLAPLPGDARAYVRGLTLEIAARVVPKQ